MENETIWLPWKYIQILFREMTFSDEHTKLINWYQLDYIDKLVEYYKCKKLITTLIF